MKKIIVILAVVFLMSCGQKYNCTCANQDTQNTYILHGTKKEAKKECDDILQGSVYTECTMW
jgi:uncharacterized protein YxeA